MSKFANLCQIVCPVLSLRCEGGVPYHGSQALLRASFVLHIETILLVGSGLLDGSGRHDVFVSQTRTLGGIDVQKRLVCMPMLSSRYCDWHVFIVTR